MAKAQKTAGFPVQGNAEIPLNLLIEWPKNVRRTRTTKGLESTAASLKVRKQLMPLLVLATDNGLFFVIDGERRRLAMNLNVGSGDMDADAPVRVFILDPATTEAELYAIATVVNVEREQMNPIEEMEAYLSMRQSGMTARQIGEQFNIGVKQVNQRVMLGGLVESARDLVRSGTRQIAWAEAMTLGSPAQQERIVSEIQANPQAFIDRHSVKMELTRGNIPVSSALFDATELSQFIVTDLFTSGEDGTFSNAEEFWKKQDVEIQKLIDEHAQTHARVDLYRGRRFNDAGWVSGGEPAQSTAVIVVRDDGSVVTKLGMVAPAGFYDDGDDGDSGDIFADAGAMFGADLESAPAEGETPIVPIRAINPLEQPTKATEAYLEAQIVAQLRLRAATDHRVSMAFVIAQTLTRHGKLASSMEIPGFNLDSDLRTSAVFQQLDARRHAYERILADTGLIGIRSPSKAVALLLDLDDAVLNEVFSWTVSQSVNPGLTPIAFDTLDVLDMAPMDGWSIDETYVDTLNNAQKRALAEEVVPIAAQPARNASIPQVVRAVISTVESDALQGDWTGPRETWLPPQITSLRDAATARADAEAEAAQAAIDAAAADERAKAA